MGVDVHSQVFVKMVIFYFFIYFILFVVYDHDGCSSAHPNLSYATPDYCCEEISVLSFVHESVRFLIRSGSVIIGEAYV